MLVIKSACTSRWNRTWPEPGMAKELVGWEQWTSSGVALAWLWWWSHAYTQTYQMGTSTYCGIYLMGDKCPHFFHSLPFPSKLLFSPGFPKWKDPLAGAVETPKVHMLLRILWHSASALVYRRQTLSVLCLLHSSQNLHDLQKTCFIWTVISTGLWVSII